ncbi:MAG TPA: BolA/IbaG family iron-sulfur metabolism protein [Thiobacillaceae bacterium]|nr:BolA/IbaG family iron-sulfur metabolism protein [Thiobacillaceae bacterium]HNA81714.1 BolA/IbaG family iron-sulfur metabolism protein [Thiobacillaceae bacterium]HNF90491.1 BolA/IbaG family iron-sulfur metabolism protein [Thiobacillaceae bacterium]HNH89764.1 BolA/IbaG family iron-sulfur metabolism protein [Thiobacillaceae bacterium]HNI09160.1 BolA/IbaG family iron-sulfur metabolism protein [Thiobacillaceae bacterium]
MVTPQQIQAWIQAGLACDHIQVAGDGQHFEALIVSPEFRGKLPVARHQIVYGVLGERMHADIHALSMKTLTPEEWAKQHG